MMPVRAPSSGLNAFFEEFEAHYQAGGLWHVIWHPFLTGRLARWRLFEQWLETMLSKRNVWFATLGEISRHVRTVQAQDPSAVRQDSLLEHVGVQPIAPIGLVRVVGGQLDTEFHDGAPQPVSCRRKPASFVEAKRCK